MKELTDSALKRVIRIQDITMKRMELQKESRKIHKEIYSLTLERERLILSLEVK